MKDSFNCLKIKVIFENYTVIHTDGNTYTRVRSRDNLVWIPIQYLPNNPVLDEIYEISREAYEHFRMIRH